MVLPPVHHFNRHKDARIPRASRLINEIDALWDTRTFCDLDMHEYHCKVDGNVFVEEHALPRTTYERMKPALQLATKFLERLRVPLMHVMLSDYDPQANVLVFDPAIEIDHAKKVEYESTLDLLRKRYPILHYPVRNRPDLSYSYTTLNPLDDVDDPSIPVVSAIASEYLQVLEAKNWEQLIPEQQQATLFSLAVRLIRELARAIWLCRMAGETKEYIQTHQGTDPPDPHLDTSEAFCNVLSLGDAIEKYLIGGITSFASDSTQPRHPTKPFLPAFDGHMGVLISNPSGGPLEGVPEKHRDVSHWTIRPKYIAQFLGADFWKGGQPIQVELSLQDKIIVTPTTIEVREDEGQRLKNAELREIFRRRGIDPDAMDVDMVRPTWTSSKKDPTPEPEADSEYAFYVAMGKLMVRNLFSWNQRSETNDSTARSEPSGPPPPYRSRASSISTSYREALLREIESEISPASQYNTASRRTRSERLAEQVWHGFGLSTHGDSRNLNNSDNQSSNRSNNSNNRNTRSNNSNPNNSGNQNNSGTQNNSGNQNNNGSNNQNGSHFNSGTNNQNQNSGHNNQNQNNGNNNQNSGNGNNSQSNSQNSNSRKKLCTICKKPNHIAANCRFRNNGNTNNNN